MTQFIGMAFQAEMSMWNSFDQLEKYMKKSDDRKPMATLHEATGRLEIKHAARAIYSIFKLIYYFKFQAESSIDFIQ